MRKSLENGAIAMIGGCKCSKIFTNDDRIGKHVEGLVHAGEENSIMWTEKVNFWQMNEKLIFALSNPIGPFHIRERKLAYRCSMDLENFS